MGGIERKGKILSGNKDEIERMVEEVLDNAPEKFILGADCTLPSDVNWDNMKIAISTAHEYKKKINQRRCGK
jgi:uroporphyrinogen decarboxylase